MRQFRLFWEAIPLSVLPPTCQPLLSHQANTPLRCWHSADLWFVVYSTGYWVRQNAVACSNETSSDGHREPTLLAVLPATNCHPPFSHQASLVPQRYSASSTNTPLWCWHSADLRPFRVQPGLLVSSDAAVPLCFVDGGICPGHQANSAPQPPVSFRCRFAKPRFPRTLGYSDAGTPRISGSVARTSSGFLRPAGSRIRSKGDHFFDLVLPRCPRSSFLLVRVLRRHLNAPLILLLTPM